MLYHREGENAAEGRKTSENDMELSKAEKIANLMARHAHVSMQLEIITKFENPMRLVDVNGDVLQMYDADSAIFKQSITQMYEKELKRIEKEIKEL